MPEPFGLHAPPSLAHDPNGSSIGHEIARRHRVTSPLHKLLSAEEAAELVALVERYDGLPDSPRATIPQDIVRLESLLDMAYRRREQMHVEQVPDTVRLLLDRAESLIPLMKVCLPGDHR